MRVVVVGMGIQGKKRKAIAGSQCVATIDPVGAADYKRIEDVPLNIYDAALVCTPDEPKFHILSYLASNKKHSLVEKPLLTKTESQISELAAIAEKNRVTVYTAYNHRFEPHIVRMKETIENGKLGRIYMGRFFYGNGTARDVRDSVWRDQGMGVLPDLGSHLLDMGLFLFGGVEALENVKFKPYSFNKYENNSLDHFLFGTVEREKGAPNLTFEATLLSYRNSFFADVYGELGSAHINCLCKWGPSIFTYRKRVLPSGKPDQEHHTLECSDPTWAIEYDFFKKLCQTGQTNLKNDKWISKNLQLLSC